MKNLILVPIHPPYFSWAKKLLDSASEKENIALGFTTEEDAEKFSHPFSFKKLISGLPNPIGTIAFVSLKKLALLRQIQNDYDYIAIIDAESQFLKETTPHLSEIWGKGPFLANRSSHGGEMMRVITQASGYPCNEDLYTWFNEIPVYKCDLLPGFFEWLASRKQENYNHFAFDHTLFAIYCRYELGMRWRVLNNPMAHHGLVESDQWSKCAELHGETHWSTFFRGVERLDNIKILFHLDRVPIRI